MLRTFLIKHSAVGGAGPASGWPSSCLPGAATGRQAWAAVLLFEADS